MIIIVMIILLLGLGYQAMSEDEPDKSILKGSESKQETDSEIITLQAEHT